MTKHAESMSAKIRKMLAEGHTPTTIATVLNIPRTYVYGVQYYDRKKEAAAKAEPKRKPGRPKGSKNKTTDAKIIALQDEINALRMQLEMTNNRPPVTVEVPVPQPISHYTFWQRVRILFGGRVSA